MFDNVELIDAKLVDENLIITLNTNNGKKDISIPLLDIITNYE